MITFGVRDLSVLVEDLTDQTKKVSAGTRDMLISAVSDMTKRSRAVRLVAYGQDSSNAIGFLQQAESKSAYSLIPQFDIKGSISQFDESVAKKETSFGVSLGEILNYGRANTGAANVIGVDLTVLDTADLSVVPGVTSRNGVLIFKQGKGVDADAQYRKFGINFSASLAKSEGNGQALRNLIELSVVELFGKLTNTPYWSCLGADPTSEAVKTEISDWYYTMSRDAEFMIGYFQYQFSLRGIYNGPVDGKSNPKLAEAIELYRGTVGLPVNAKIDLTFAKALRAILRQDPDVIMIGEIRDFETAQIAIQASLTGHLVLATLHTNDAASAVNRLIDMGVDVGVVRKAGSWFTYGDDQLGQGKENSRNYLLANPEVIVEAMTALQNREDEAAYQRDIDMLQANADIIFNSPADWVGGNPQGDITVVEFMDYRCGYCRKAYEEVEELVKSDGNIRFVLKEFPILGEQSLWSSQFAIAVRMLYGDDAYKAAHDALVTLRGDATPEPLAKLAAELGHDPAAVAAKMGSDEVKAVITANHELATLMEINGTPTFVIDQTMVRGYVPLDGMQQIVDGQRNDG